MGSTELIFDLTKSNQYFLRELWWGKAEIKTNKLMRNSVVTAAAMSAEFTEFYLNRNETLS